MHSPLHNNRSMQSVEIESGLHAWQCPASQGYWIPLASYTRWQQSMPVVIPPSAEIPEVQDDAEKAPMFCPESGALLQRFNVGKGATFRIERSPVTGGIWLDAGEWEALKALGIHNEIHHIFTASYQSRVRREAADAALEKLVREKVGDDNYQKLLEIKNLLTNSPHGRDMLNYLIDRVGR